MPSRECIVSFTDTHGISHSVRVHAGTLYEAAALALAEFRSTDLIEAKPGRATTLTISVRPPATVHELTVGRLEDWLDGGAKSPNDLVEKKRLKDLLSKNVRTLS